MSADPVLTGRHRNESMSLKGTFHPLDLRADGYVELFALRMMALRGIATSRTSHIREVHVPQIWERFLSASC
jgi:hypothetical protein